MARKPKDTTAPLRFDQKLVLNQWILSLFGDDVRALGDIVTADMKRPDCEGRDENNVTLFHYQLVNRVRNRPSLTDDQLLAYDENIVRHTERINARRIEPVRWKYFQYLALLFAEIYLDRYFRDREGLLAELNAHVGRFNAGEWYHVPGRLASPLSKRDCVKPYTAETLNKVAFWSATGSGKTLLMHVNILQYLHYLERYGRQSDLNRVILLTPNEGLSAQHHEELQASGIPSEVFSKNGGGLRFGRTVEIIDIHKLRDEMGEKTVAVDAFEANNLVLVDEGHTGASGYEWKSRRDRLCERGFSFEYSATFAQAVRAAANAGLEQEYARCILFDYSYRHFYHDGYGKDFRILNLADDSDRDVRDLYLTACLTAFYQQLRLHDDREAEFRPFLIDKPLWIFVGRSVTAGTSQADKQTMSDVVTILRLLADFVGDRARSVGMLERLLGGAPGLVDERGREIFRETFSYIWRLGLTPAQVYADILARLFNAPAGGILHVENLKGVDGEIALRVGENEPFGLINVGEDSKLCRLCEEHGLPAVTELEFGRSLFEEINEDDSTINMLIGAKKFTQGWNSWRVTTTGLLNIGRGEGSEIIQLFGRGVRLRGYEWGLKRTKHVDGLTPPEHIELLETLNVFGVRADYMRQFREYLEDEGVCPESELEEIVLPVTNLLGEKKLKMVRLPEGLSFKKDGPRPRLSAAENAPVRSLVELNYYPKVQARVSADLADAPDATGLNEAYLQPAHIAFMDLDALYLDLQQFKKDRGWHNMELPREELPVLLTRKDWYRLYIPPEELEISSFAKVNRWEEIARALLRKCCARQYGNAQAAWEEKHMQCRFLSADDPNFITEYRILVDESAGEIAERLRQLKEEIDAGRLQELEWGTLHAICFDRHLYEPLLYVKKQGGVHVAPVALQDGERDFVLRLRDRCARGGGVLDGNELCLLRNQSRGRGAGFFEAGNFYPDFIMWLVVGDHQYVTFIDPKGIRNIDGPEDPKIAFRHTVKGIERRVADPALTLNSCILSGTRPDELPHWLRPPVNPHDLHIFSQHKPDYIDRVLEVAMKAE